MRTDFIIARTLTYILLLCSLLIIKYRDGITALTGVIMFIVGLLLLEIKNE